MGKRGGKERRKKEGESLVKRRGTCGTSAESKGERVGKREGSVKKRLK